MTRFIVWRVTSTGGEPPCEEATRDGDNWVVHLDDLDDLLRFCERYGQVIVSYVRKWGSAVDEPCIEIYDDYIE